MKPSIGIPCATIRDKDWCPPAFGHRQSYIDAVVRVGGIPLLIPLVEQEDVLRALYERIDGLLLAGGGDIVPDYYGETPQPSLELLDPLRDQVEIRLTRWAVAEGKPVLGICRGVQVVNVALGGTLYQDVASQLETPLAHDASHELCNWTHMAHPIRLDPASRLAHLLGAPDLLTNSLHHQSLKAIAPGLRAVGWAPDGVIEAVEGTNGQFLLGVQGHPEALEADADPRWQAMFRAFVASSGAFRHSVPAETAAVGANI